MAFLSKNNNLCQLRHRACTGGQKGFNRGHAQPNNIPTTLATVMGKGKSIFAHDPKGKVAESYRELTERDHSIRERLSKAKEQAKQPTVAEGK